MTIYTLGDEVLFSGGGLLQKTAAGEGVPSDISLTQSSIPEDATIGTPVAVISADVDATFALVSDPDGKFAIVGDVLETAATLDYGTATSHTISIRASVAGVGSYTEQFVIAVTEVVVVPPPEEVAALSAQSVEAVGATAALGRVTTDDGTGTIHTVVTTSATTPTATQIAAGQNHTGAVALAYLATAPSAAGEYLPFFVGLPSETSGLYLHFAHENAAGLSTAVSSATFATGAIVTAYPTVSGAVISKTPSASTTHTVTAPSGSSAGDEIRVAMRLKPVADVIPPAGFDLVEKWNSAGTGIYFENWTFVKTALATEPATYDFTMHTACHSISIAFVVSGSAETEFQLGWFFDPEPLAPSWGSTAKTAWVALSLARGTGFDLTGGPSGYSGFVTDKNLNADGGLVAGFAAKQSQTATEDAGVFASSGSVPSTAQRSGAFGFKGIRAPTAIVLSNATVPDLSASGTLVGRLYSDGGVSYEITDDADGKFVIAGVDQLRLADAVDNSASASHSVTVEATNAEGGTYAEVLVVGVGEEASPGTAPTDISLSALSVSEDAQVGSTIATITVDGDPAPTLTDVTAYENPDDQFFDVVGSSVVLVQGLDYATATSHDITIRAANSAGNYDEPFTINVTQVVTAPPSNIALSSSAIVETAAAGALVGTLSANGDTPITFSKVADPDNKFTVSGVELRLAATVDYDVKTSHSVTVRATNAAGSADKVFTIAVIESVPQGTQLFAAAWESSVQPELGTPVLWYGSALSTHSIVRNGLMGPVADSGHTFDLSAYGSEGLNGTIYADFVAWDGDSGLSKLTRILFRWTGPDTLTFDARNDATGRYVQVRKKINNVYSTIATLTNAQVAALFTAFTWGADGSMSSNLGVRIVMSGGNITIYLKDVANSEEKLGFSFSVSEAPLLTSPRHGFTIESPSILDYIVYITDPAPAAISGLSSTSIQDDAQVGDLVAVVQYSGSPTPTLTKTADPDGKFNLVGDQLLLAATIDAGVDNSHPVTIFAENTIGTDELSTAITVTAAPEAPDPGDPVTQLTVTGPYGDIMYKWTTPAVAGIDPTGRAWVKEPSGGLKGVSVTPAQTTIGSSVVHGLMLNPARTGTNSPQGFDQRMPNWDATLNVQNTIGQMTLNAGDKLIKANTWLASTKAGRWGSTGEYACLHVVDTIPPGANSILRSTVTWSGRNDPSAWYNNVDVDGFIASRPTKSLAHGEWPAFSLMESRVLRCNPVWGLGTSDGDSGYQWYFSFHWGSGPEGSTSNKNYGEAIAGMMRYVGLALCCTGHGYTDDQLKKILWRLVGNGVETIDPMLGRPTSDPFARGAHCQWHYLTVCAALNMTGRASLMPTVFAPGGTMNGNIQQGFALNSEILSRCVPHSDTSNNSNKAGFAVIRTLGSQAGAGANRMLLKKVNSNEFTNRGCKVAAGIVIRNLSNTKRATVSGNSNNNDDKTGGPWDVPLTGANPFTSGDQVYMEPPSGWMAEGQYHWSERGPSEVLIKFAPSMHLTYSGQQKWGPQIMAVCDLGWYHSSLERGVGFMIAAALSNYPTSSNNYDNPISGSLAQTYYSTWSTPPGY